LIRSKSTSKNNMHCSKFWDLWWWGHDKDSQVHDFPFPILPVSVCFGFSYFLLRIFNWSELLVEININNNGPLLFRVHFSTRISSQTLRRYKCILFIENFFNIRMIDSGIIFHAKYDDDVRFFLWIGVIKLCVPSF